MRSILFVIVLLSLSLPCLAADRVAASTVDEPDATPNNLSALATENEDPIWSTALCLVLGFGSLVLVRRNIQGLKTRRQV